MKLFSKVLIAIFSISIVLLVGHRIATEFIFKDLPDPIIAEGEETIITSLGDEFLIKYNTRGFPELETTVYISDMSKRNILGYYHEKYEYKKPNCIVQIVLPNLRYYKIGYLRIYKVNNGIFKGISRAVTESEKNSEKEDFRVIAKMLFQQKEWKWIVAGSEFLSKADDTSTRETLSRYANGEFTQNEIEINKKSTIKKADMQNFAKQLLEKK